MATPPPPRHWAAAVLVIAATLCACVRPAAAVPWLAGDVAVNADDGVYILDSNLTAIKDFIDTSFVVVNGTKGCDNVGLRFNPSNTRLYVSCADLVLVYDAVDTLHPLLGNFTHCLKGELIEDMVFDDEGFIYASGDNAEVGLCKYAEVCGPELVSLVTAKWGGSVRTDYVGFSCQTQKVLATDEVNVLASEKGTTGNLTVYAKFSTNVSDEANGVVGRLASTNVYLASLFKCVYELAPSTVATTIVDQRCPKTDGVGPSIAQDSTGSYLYFSSGKNSSVISKLDLGDFSVVADSGELLSTADEAGLAVLGGTSAGLCFTGEPFSCPKTVSIAITGPTTTVPVNTPFNYTINVTVAGGTAKDVNVTLHLPTGLQFVGTAPKGCSYSTPPGNLTCALGSVAVPGTSFPVTAKATTAGTVTVTAVVSASNGATPSSSGSTTNTAAGVPCAPGPCCSGGFLVRAGTVCVWAADAGSKYALPSAYRGEASECKTCGDSAPAPACMGTCSAAGVCTLNKPTNFRKKRACCKLATPVCYGSIKNVCYGNVRNKKTRDCYCLTPTK